MTAFSLLLLLLVAILVVPSLATFEITSSTPFCSKQRNKVVFNCSPPPYSNPSNARISFHSEGELLYDSVTKKTGKNVQIINSTSIQVSNVNDELKRVHCNFDGEESLSVDIPYVDIKGYGHNVHKIVVNQTFTASCDIDIRGQRRGQYIVVFRRNNDAFAQYEVDNDQARFASFPNSDFTATPDSQLYPNYSILVRPIYVRPTDRFRCSIHWKQEVIIESDELDGNKASLIALSNFIVVLIVGVHVYCAQ